MLMANEIGSNNSQVVSKAGFLEGECPFFAPFLQLNCQGGNVAVSLFCLLKGLGHSLHLDRRRKDVKATHGAAAQWGRHEGELGLTKHT